MAASSIELFTGLVRERRNLYVAATATVLVLLWMFVTVHANYRGDWTAFFCIGSSRRMPPELNSGWSFVKSRGYDGQWYRLVAHDPWMHKGYARYLDNPQRYQRILLPVVAWLLAFGHSAWVDNTYILAVLLFLFAGVWLTAKWIVLQGYSPWYALGFALLPGTLISIDRMTMDIAEYAFIAAGLYYWRRQNWVACWIAAVAAVLTRDLGLLLVLAFVGLWVVQKAWRRAIVFAGAVIPGVWWYWHVAHTLALRRAVHYAVPYWFRFLNPLGPVYAIIHPQNYALTGWIKGATQFLDGIAIAGVMLAVGLAIFVYLRSPRTLDSAICGSFVVLFILVSVQGFWVDPDSFPRAFSPLIGLIAWRGVTDKRAWFVIPAYCLLARTLWQFGPQVLGIVKAMLS